MTTRSWRGVYLHAPGESRAIRSWRARVAEEHALIMCCARMTAPATAASTSTQGCRFPEGGREGKFLCLVRRRAARRARRRWLSNLDALLRYWGITAAGNFEAGISCTGRICWRGSQCGTVRWSREQIARRCLGGQNGAVHAAQRAHPARQGRTRFWRRWNGDDAGGAGRSRARCWAATSTGQAALDNASFLLGEMQTENGRLHRTHPGPGRSRLDAYRRLRPRDRGAAGAVSNQRFDRTRWLSRRSGLAEIVLGHFRGRTRADSYDTSDEHEDIGLVRPDNVQDSAAPSGSAMIAYVLLPADRLHRRDTL